MKIGVFMVLFGNWELGKALDYVKGLGITTVEIGAGNYPGDAHCQPRRLLAKPAALRRWKEQFDSRGMEISALSCHGNPLHPDERIAKAHRTVQRETIRLAKALGVKRVATFSGCPGGSARSARPNWITCPWPSDFSDALKWQWERRVIPFWKDEAKFARDHGIKVCIEPHPGFVVYNTETLLRLRDECGKNIGANLDPSHLFWQGMNPLTVARALSDAVFHVHAKDVRIDALNVSLNGVLDTKHYGNEVERGWIFRTVGYGHDALFWKDFVSTLRTVGYDDVLSIEHEDSLMSVDEGLRKAVEFLKGVVLHEPRGAMWWA
jgi:sugar phosphate isomerase/epimerase